MKRIVITTIFTLIIIMMYQFVDINFFTIDLPRRVSSELFTGLRAPVPVDDDVFILDIEYIHLDSVKTRLEYLEALEPKVIGVNLCNIEDTSRVLDDFLRNSEKIITCDCDANSDKGTSRITSPENVVTHFRTDKNSYFELRLANRSNEFEQRENEEERINFREVESYYQAPLDEIENIPFDFIKGKIVLVGFLRDSLITPMNDWYRNPGIVRGDMSDV